MENIIRERRWTGHFLRVDQESITKAAVRWIQSYGKRKPGHPKIDRIQTVKDIKKEVIWEIPELAVDIEIWKGLSALWANFGTGGSKV